MRILYILPFLLGFGISYSQTDTQTIPNTEVYLFDLITQNGKTTLANVKNVSDNDGYDNQPSFMKDYLLYASTRNGQTDIVKYWLPYGSRTWLNFTEGSEYSPLKIPGQDAVSAINLESDGSQKLYKYSINTGESEVLVEDIVIGYQLWYDENTLISSVLENDMLNLYKTEISTGADTKLADNIGRSLQKIPNSNKVGYISKANPDKWEIRSIDINSGKSTFIINTVTGSEDMVYLKNGAILMGADSKIMKSNGKTWSEWVDLKENGIGKISRMAIDQDEIKFAVVGESNGAIITSGDNSPTTDSPQVSDINANASAIVQSHVDAFNNGNAEGFLALFSEDVLVANFPDDVVYTGKNKMRANFSDYAKNNKNLSMRVNKRIALGDYVIDEELITENNAVSRQVKIYTITNDKISSSRLIKNEGNSDNLEKLVNQQLQGANESNIDAFMASYANDVKLYNFPSELKEDGASTVRKNYSEFFKQAPDLRVIVLNRIVIGNKVIDEEEITSKGNSYRDISIYEIENGKIKRVTFIQ
ncbi:hypothetical protein SAMN03097699_0230 [Flavobacteriaceae bacterium MAR_2010_188]|nr:hypothetical protein SAMN03097699_0230 [Flavobacteriaceae bacterium MAR_2010_188]